MYLTTLPPEQAIGHILRHNLSGPDGRKAFAKGHRIAAADLPRLSALGLEQLRVAVLEPGDVHEDEAARRLAAAVCGPGVLARPPAASRVNLLAAADGVVRVDMVALLQINEIDGLTIATLPSHRLARARQRVATIKIIPFAVLEEDLARAEAIGREARAGHRSVIALSPLRQLDVGVILVGSAAARTRIEAGVYPAIEARVVALGSRVLAVRYVESEEQVIAETIGELRAAGVHLLIVAGETSIMDRDDVTPQGIRLAGGRIEHYGAPVEPGNLLLLGYLDTLPVLGAPGCVRSRDVNIVDLLLPRLLAGEQITRRDIVELGHGGLLG
ncbi:MAG: molybdopterin-binding protein [Roseiflexaceae bacterium]